MRFASVVYRIAGIWGIVVLTPLYFLVDLTGRRYGAPVDYPQFFYGFLSVAMAWQISSPGVERPRSERPGSVDRSGTPTFPLLNRLRKAPRLVRRRSKIAGS